MRKYKIAIIILFVLPLFSFANSVTLKNPLDYGSIPELVAALISFITTIALVVAPILFIIAGFYYLGGGTNPENVKKAKDIFKWTVVGIAVVLLASSVSYLIKDILSEGVDTEGLIMQYFI